MGMKAGSRSELTLGCQPSDANAMGQLFERPAT
jgi:hypothetical protein